MNTLKLLSIATFLMFCRTFAFSQTQTTDNLQISEATSNSTYQYNVTVSTSNDEIAAGLMKEAFTNLRRSIKPAICSNVLFVTNDDGTYSIQFDSKELISEDQVKLAFYSSPLTLLSFNKLIETLEFSTESQD